MKRVITASLILSTLFLGGCSSTDVSDVQAPQVYQVATRRWAPEPVYNRLRWARPPQVHPERAHPQVDSPLIMPVVHFSVKDETLKDVVLILGANSRYKTYCSPLIAGEKLTMDMLGTMEEIAVAIEDSKNIQVILDHEAEELRFEARGGEYRSAQIAEPAENNIIFSRLER